MAQQEMIFRFWVTGATSIKINKVVFKAKNSRLLITCDCEDGLRGQVCRHKLALCRGDIRGLVDEQQQRDLLFILQWVGRTTIRVLIDDMDRKHAQLELLIEQMRNAKETLGRAMANGTPFTDEESSSSEDSSLAGA